MRNAPKRPGYREAVEWIAANDDCFWTDEPEHGMSVTASMVRDLWDKTDEQVTKDITRKWRQIYPKAKR